MRVYICQCLVMIQQWHDRHKDVTNTADLLRDALRAIGRDDVIAQCMTGYQQVLDYRGRQQALDALVERTYFSASRQDTISLFSVA